MQLLIQKEIQKQEYSKALKEQMEDNKHRKIEHRQKVAEADVRMDYEIKNYNPYGRGGGGAPNIKDDG